MDKLGLEPAFPVDGIYAADAFRGNNTGISKRLYIATKIAQGLASNEKWAQTMCPDDFDEFKERLCSASFDIADELLKQENDV
jgi:hypothetical protein